MYVVNIQSKLICFFFFFFQSGISSTKGSFLWEGLHLNAVIKSQSESETQQQTIFEQEKPSAADPLLRDPC